MYPRLTLFMTTQVIFSFFFSLSPPPFQGVMYVTQDCLRLATWLNSIESSAGIELLTILFLRGAGTPCVCHCAHLLALGSALRRFRLPASVPCVRARARELLTLCYGTCSVVCVLPSCLASTELQHPKPVFFLFLA